MPDIRFLFQNLFINKYEIQSAKRPGVDILQLVALKKDEFGNKNTYNFLFVPAGFSETKISGLKKQSKGTPIVISCVKGPGIDFTEPEFFDKFRTIINHGVYLNPNLKTLLSELGHNRLPPGITGKPDDLLEEYSKECLQFLLGGAGRRYGKERSFESLPDGVIMGDDVTVLFDAKAYSNGFNPTADDIKRFSSYVNDFNRKYSPFTNKVYAFIVISGHFEVGDNALNERSDELYEKCQTKLVFINAEELAQIVKLSIDNLDLLPTINWKRILYKAIPTAANLEEQLKTNQKDKII